MIHFPSVESLQGMFYGIILIAAVIGIDVWKSDRTLPQAAWRWVVLFIVFLISFLQSIGFVWYLALALGLIFAFTTDRIRNRQDKNKGS